MKITWQLEENIEEFHKRLPYDAPISITASLGQQFIMSRKMVHRLPLSTWKKLLLIIHGQSVCHKEDLDYEHLHAYKSHEDMESRNSTDSFGRSIQGSSMEYLSHVIFGDQPLQARFPTMKEICEIYEENCPFSPCNHKIRLELH